MVKLKYAAYGSNLHPVRLSERTPSARYLGKTVLEGWALHFHKRSRDGSGKCNIVKDEMQQIYIGVYEIDKSEKPLLDTIEAVDCGYRCEYIEVADFGRCFTYLADGTHIDDSLRPYAWYKALVLAGCETLAFPGSYTDRIHGFDAIDDPDKLRTARHRELLVRLREYNNPGT